MLYESGYSSWDFDNIWKIDEGSSIAYLKNTDKPDSVKKENISYLDFTIQGDGTENNPYLIKNAIQLQKLRENLTAYYKLANDIELTGTDWNPIGDIANPFKGQLDGAGYTINNLSINKSENYEGLFGYNQGIIKSIKLNNFNVTGVNYVAALVAYNLGTITDCTITNLNITGTSYVGGLAGYNSGSISSATVGGTVTGTNTYVGGLVGYDTENITSSTSSATVSGTSYVGGLIGYAYVNNDNVTIDNSKATGTVQGTTNVGGLIGAEYIYHTYAADSVTYAMYVKRCYASRRCNRNR